MERLQSSFSGKKDFFVVSFNLTVDDILERQKNIVSLQKWVISLWTAALGFSFSNHFTLLQLIAILFPLTTGFFFLHIFQIAMKDRLIDISCQMEDYLTTVDLLTLPDEKRRLWGIIVSDRKKIKRVWFYVKGAFKQWEESVFYFILFSASFIIPFSIFISKHFHF